MARDTCVNPLGGWPIVPKPAPSLVELIAALQAAEDDAFAIAMSDDFAETNGRLPAVRARVRAARAALDAATTR